MPQTIRNGKEGSLVHTVQMEKGLQSFWRLKTTEIRHKKIVNYNNVRESNFGGRFEDEEHIQL